MELLGRYKTLIAEVENRKPKTILEVGTHRGNSAITMVNKAKEYNDDVY
jgi:predicted O-methyltransferase YrrM